MITVSSKGQIVIPSEIRKELGIKAGSKLNMHITDNQIVLTPTWILLEKLHGILNEPGLLDQYMSEKESEKIQENKRG